MLKELISLGAILQIVAIGNSHAVSSGMISATGSGITYSYTFIYQAFILNFVSLQLNCSPTTTLLATLVSLEMQLTSFNKPYHRDGRL